MATISVPLSVELEERLNTLVTNGAGSSRADVMRNALEDFAEKEAVRAILDAAKEPTLHGNVRELLKQI